MAGTSDADAAAPPPCSAASDFTPPLGLPAAADAAPDSAPPAAADCRQENTHLPQVGVSHLATLPGLAGVGSLLGLEATAQVRVLIDAHFTSRVTGGLQQRQLVRATLAYRKGSWYDFLAYPRDGDGAAAVERIAQVQALVGLHNADVAVVAKLVPTGEDDGPLNSRGCTSLQWSWEEGTGAGAGRVRLLRVPATHWRRVVHVVPGFADLFSRHGVGATPAELGGADADVRQQRYDLNAFHHKRA